MPTEMRGSGWRKLVSGGGRTTGAGRVQQRVRRLPARAVVWFVLALTPFGGQGYRSLWRELAHGGDEGAVTPSASGLSQARRRLGVAPLARLFARLRGPQAQPGAAGSFPSGLGATCRVGRRSLDPTTAPRARAATVKNARVRIAPRSISRRVSSKVPARIATSATLGAPRARCTSPPTR